MYLLTIKYYQKKAVKTRSSVKVKSKDIKKYIGKIKPYLLLDIIVTYFLTTVASPVIIKSFTIYSCLRLML